jgi:plastocyanin
MLMKLLLAAAAASQATATTTIINVGQNGLAFSPNSVTASVGDILEFHFFAGDHSAGLADFSSPCKPSANGGFFSGFMADTVRCRHLDARPVSIDMFRRARHSRSR